MKSIFNIIEPCDVIVFNGKWYNPYEVLVMIRSGTQFCHCSTVVNITGNIDDALLDGVVLNNISQYEGYSAVVMRYKFSFDSKKLLKYLTNTRLKSQGYDFLAWIGFLLNDSKLQNDDNRWYCSERPYWMFEENGYEITKKDKLLLLPSFFVKDSDSFDKVWEGVI